MDKRPRVAIVGAGPAGFYAAEALLKGEGDFAIDFVNRLPTPYGLVRDGVAPDHQAIKSVTRVYARILSRDEVRYFGNVTLGRDLSVDDLRRRYDHVVYAVGAQSDRRMGIPGEDFGGSRAAFEFVAWYNGHPDYRGASFDLSCKDVVVVGNGNVAIDVARILVHSPSTLAGTDIADHALEALRASRVRRVTLLGRRGPAQASFTNPELREFGRIDGVCAQVDAAELEIDAASEASLAQSAVKQRNMKTLAGYAAAWEDRGCGDGERTVRFRFLVSPVEVLANGGRVTGARVERNRLVAREDGYMRAEGTGATEIVPCGLLIRSVGYRGVPIPGLPYCERRGVFPNAGGRLLAGATDRNPVGGGSGGRGAGATVPGEYVVGWAKRGPSGVIGTNKADAAATVKLLVEDLAAGVGCRRGDGGDLADLLRNRGVRWVDKEGWGRIDAHETGRGKAEGRPRVKLCTVDEMTTIAGEATAGTARRVSPTDAA